MPRAKWVVGVLTVALLCTGLGVLHSTEGGRPAAPTAGDALSSRVLGLSGPRRLARQLEHSGGHTAGKDSRRPGRSGTTALPAAVPLRLVIPGLEMDVPLTGGTPPGGDAWPHGPRTADGGPGAADAKPPVPDSAVWDSAGPAPGAAGTAVVSGDIPRLGELRRGQTIEVPRADRRTAVFTVSRVSPAGISGRGGPSGRAQLRLTSGETAVLARLTGHRRTPR
ncbi:class F sortase [Streptomyces sp. H34-S4]|uniref:class F sortase n=1 Tax=Streptomyces sp. H34-S4 TaxID=2996463 RepID=UPI00226DEF42|nr:class F sortase [Streptomyces sp. H34-S4]MCY0934157.1 class F sortase [Streptomyces sp. H34-S4]